MSPTDLPERKLPLDPAYGLTCMGAMLGGGGGAALGFLLGQAYSNRFMPSAELEGIVPVVIGELAGVWLGALLGTWAALAARHKVAAVSTSLLLAGALPAWGIVSLPSFFWLIQQLSGDDIPDLLQIAAPILILCIPPAAAARALVVHRELIRVREEISS